MSPEDILTRMEAMGWADCALRAAARGDEVGFVAIYTSGAETFRNTITAQTQAAALSALSNWLDQQELE